MKFKSKQSPHLKKLTWLVASMFAFSYLLSMHNENNMTLHETFTRFIVYDDTIPSGEGEMPDTTDLVQETVIDGIDTIWYIQADETGEMVEELKLGLTHDSVITINLGNQKKSVVKSLYGFATAGIFTRLQMPMPTGADTFSVDQWQWMSDLKPEVLRFPGGADSKFMDVLKGPGYGYDLAKLIRYYDVTDHVLDYPTLADVLDDEDHPDSLGQWITDTLGGLYINQFAEFKAKWDAQQLLDTTHRYIDDFIELIKKIETDDTTHCACSLLFRYFQ